MSGPLLGHGLRVAFAGAANIYYVGNTYIGFPHIRVGMVSHGSQISIPPRQLTRQVVARGAVRRGVPASPTRRSPTSHRRAFELHARRDGYQVTFAANAVGPLTVLGHDISLRRMEHESITVATAATVMAELADDYPHVRIGCGPAANHDAAQRGSDARSGHAALATATTTPAFEINEKEPSCSPCPSKPAAPARTLALESWAIGRSETLLSELVTILREKHLTGNSGRGTPHRRAHHCDPGRGSRPGVIRHRIRRTVRPRIHCWTHAERNDHGTLPQPFKRIAGDPPTNPKVPDRVQSRDQVTDVVLVD